MGVTGWSLAFIGLVAGAGAGLFIFEGTVPALLLAAVALVSLCRLKTANDERSAARQGSTPLRGPTWLSGQELRDRTSFDLATREGSAP